MSVCLTSVWCLSRTSGLSREQRGLAGKTKISTEVAHVTCDSDTSFKVKRSRSPGSFTQRYHNTSGSCSGQRGNVLGVGNYCYVAVCSAALYICASAPTEGWEGKILSWSLRGFLFPVCAKLRNKDVYSAFGGSTSSSQPRPPNRFSRIMHQTTRFRAKRLAFSGLENKKLTFNPLIPEKNCHFGAAFDGT